MSSVRVLSRPCLPPGWLRQFSPHALGSGIPHVKAVLREEVPPAPFALVPVKFLGGLLAIGSGLALGREGPTVQMGAGIAVSAARVSRLCWADARVLLAAGAGASASAMVATHPMAMAAAVRVTRIELRNVIPRRSSPAAARTSGSNPRKRGR